MLLEAQETRSLVLLNQGKGDWAVTPLPHPAQVAPIRGMAVTDANRDGHADLITAGNDYAAEVLTGRYDAGIGCILLGDGRGGFAHWPNRQHGWTVDGNARNVLALPTAQGGTMIVASQNRGALRAFVQQ